MIERKQPTAAAKTDPYKADQSIANELRTLRASVQRIEEFITSATQSLTSLNNPATRPSIILTMRALGTERFPFGVEITGGITYSDRLSPVRLSLLSVLFRDLQDRLSGGPGIVNKQSIVIDFVSRLGYSLSTKALNTAIYRFETDFIAAINKVESQFDISFNRAHLQIAIVARKAKTIIPDVAVDVTSLEPKIDALLQELLPASPLAQARSRKVLFVHGGPVGFDRLFLELFDHAHRMREESMFFKPSIITYPDSLLNFIMASQQDCQRRQIALEGFATGRCKFQEILNNSTLQSLITCTAKGHFLLYSPTVTQRHVEDHLGEIIRMVDSYKHYQLVLTDCPLPFLLSLFEIHSGASAESYTIFFRQLIREHDPDVSCFVINDPTILSIVRKHVIGWVLNHPSTITDVASVSATLRKALKKLHEEGPITQAGS